MNKQEAIEKLKSKLFLDSGSSGFPLGYNEALNEAMYIINQLDEQEKPLVPQFVADMIVEKKREYGIIDTIKNLGVFNNPFDLVVEKQLNWIVENQEDFVKAWLYGYEIDKEKLYTVELPNPNAGGHVVLCKTSDGIVSIFFTGMARWQGCKNFQLTEAEIKKDFEWAWRFAEDVKEC